MTGNKRGTFSERKLHAIKEGVLYPRLKTFAMGEAQPLLREIKNRKQGDKVRKALVNYLITRTVTIFEIYLLNEAHRLSKKDQEKTKKLFTDIKTNFSLEDQLVSTYSFTKLEDIDHVFSILLDKQYLTEIKKESIEYAPNYCYEDVHIKRTNPLHKNWDYVCKIFELRHDIVHHNKLVDLKYSDIRNLIGGIIQFLLCSMMVTEQN